MNIATSARNRNDHRIHHSSWLRAAVLGANDGVISTASLIVGVAAASVARHELLVSGLAGMAAGALSMAAGEFVSVSSQADTEKADLQLERQHLDSDYEFERDELAKIYRDRGLNESLASEVAEALMAHDDLAAHARDELGITASSTARPLQACIASASTFVLGAAIPLVTATLAPGDYLIVCVVIATIFALLVLGAASSKIGGAPIHVGAIRVTLWGVLAMVVTSLIGWLVPGNLPN